MHHSLISSIINDDGGFVLIWRKAITNPDSLTDEEEIRFFAFASAMFRFFEASRVQWLRGQLDEEHWRSIEQQAIIASVHAGIKAFWRVRRKWHSDGFQEWFEALPATEAGALYRKVEPAGTPAEGSP